MLHDKMIALKTNSANSNACNENLLLLAWTASRMAYLATNQLEGKLEKSPSVKDLFCLCKDRIGCQNAKEEKHLTNSKLTDKKIYIKSGNKKSMEKQMKRQRVVRRATFAAKLMAILLDDTNQNVITWCNKGKAFSITNPEKFVQHLLPNAFKQAKLETFTRKLYRWDFRRVANAPSDETFYHSLLRDNPVLCLKMRSGNLVSNNVATVNDPFHNARCANGIKIPF